MVTLPVAKTEKSIARRRATYEEYLEIAGDARIISSAEGIPADLKAPYIAFLNALEK